MKIYAAKGNYIRIFSVVLTMLTLMVFSTDAESKVPDGSYKDSCKDIKMLKMVLTASCENEKGQWVSSKINVEYCEGDIRNDNGTLKCKQKTCSQAPGRELCEQLQGHKGEGQ